MAMANKDLTRLARELRNNPTPQENHLWYDFLRIQPVRFLRQKVMGPYIVDFYSAELKLVIEIDGSQHFELENEEKDRRRTEFLERNYGVRVVRFDNHQINTNFDGVCERLMEIMGIE